jgi:hypothetical protein
MKENEKTEECIYCRCDVTQHENPHFSDPPDTLDDDGWSRESEEHADDCEWVLTRAHNLWRRPDGLYESNSRCGYAYAGRGVRLTHVSSPLSARPITAKLEV